MTRYDIAVSDRRVRATPPGRKARKQRTHFEECKRAATLGPILTFTLPRTLNDGIRPGIS